MEADVCSDECGDGGWLYSTRTVLSLPAHGGAQCPGPSELITRVACPAAMSATLPECNGEEDETTCSAITDALPPCGASDETCGLCETGRACSIDVDCGGGTVCRPLVDASVSNVTRPRRCLPSAPSSSSGVSSLASVLAMLPDLPSMARLDQEDDTVTDTLGLPLRAGATGEEASLGAVVQLVLGARQGSRLAQSAAGLDAVRDGFGSLLQGLLPPGWAVRGTQLTIAAEKELADVSGGDEDVSDDTGSAEATISRRLRAVRWRARILQVASDADTDEVRVLLAASVTQNSSMGSATVQETESVVAAAVSGLLIERAAIESGLTAAAVRADPAAAGFSLESEDDPVYVVVAALDGAVVGGTPGLVSDLLQAQLAAGARSFAAPPSGEAGDGEGGGEDEAGGVSIGIIIAGAVGGGVVLLSALYGLSMCCRSKYSR